MSTYLVTIRNTRAKREAARQYILAADTHRAVARDCREAGCRAEAEYRERIAADLIRAASRELVA